MPLFKWFAKKKTVAPASQPPETSGLGHVEVTLPQLPHAGPVSRPANGGTAANRKTERLERRELLYAIVRESMTNAGVLSSSYKFKVLSLDSHGTRYLIMMDLPRNQAGDSLRLAEIESQIARSAKLMHEIFVTAVYWRVNDHVTAGLTQRRVADAQVGQLISDDEPHATGVATTPPVYEPLQPDELLAFKRATVAHAAAPPLRDGDLVRSGRRNPAPPTSFADTQIEEPPSMLSGSQYGDLN